MIDRELLTRKLLLIGSDLARLRNILPESSQNFLADDLTQAAVERLLERMIIRMIDANYHVLVESGEPPPPDYYQSFVRLAQLGVLAPDFARRIASAAGLRNRLVHEYDSIDYSILFHAAQKAVSDIDEYMRQVENFLESPG